MAAKGSDRPFNTLLHKTRIYSVTQRRKGAKALRKTKDNLASIGKLLYCAIATQSYFPSTHIAALNMPVGNNIRIFDTTMRDGELTPGVKMSMVEKISIAKLLEEMGVDVIEVGYPGKIEKDFDQVWNISKIIKNSIICGLASSNEDEIISVAQAIEPAQKGRINIYTNVNIKDAKKEQVLETIQNSVSLAKHYCEDVQWSAFDATRSKPEFLCQAVEVAINSGATTISIPDSLGTATPEEFSQLIQSVINLSNIDIVVSVHCHDDLGLAVDNSIAALDCGVRQIECAINGLGARKGNADLEIVAQVLKEKNYKTQINTSLINQASELVTKITGIEKKAVS